MSKKGNFLLGLGAGLGLGFLFAPKSGDETREILKNKCVELLEKVKSIKPSEVKDSIIAKVNEIQRELKQLNKEKVKEIAVQKAEAIKTKSEEIYHLALEKGTPAVQKAASDVKNAAINTLKALTSKLEEEPKKTSKK